MDGWKHGCRVPQSVTLRSPFHGRLETCQTPSTYDAQDASVPWTPGNVVALHAVHEATVVGSTGDCNPESRRDWRQSCSRLLHGCLELQQLAPADRQRFAERRHGVDGGWIDFAAFRDLLRGHGKHSFRGAIDHRALANPEVIWFVLRSYIKGFKIDKAGDDRWMRPEEYADGDIVYRKDRQVSVELYRQVWEHVWPWYKRLTVPCAENNDSPPYWDDLDLAWQVLRKRKPDAPDFPILVCDEVQDFTRVELAALLGCLTWRRFDYESVQTRYVKGIPIPVVLAGDAHQTVNPSCFR